ncbi:hypothetical protein RFI_33106 [Reticulomyxa filosa]|uniref:Uncharacterized protein n=1 Tax=Reticulomyxa filosa TaxID=46433 RepID=X6LSD2_RETFI|nr:hypothetical protein RFI_33106 [Reticulomyxa filosa]|eukprot:ETO04291.1 hypothetical protein RFI_33106 [Reticulomyxa filosa]
MFVCLSVWGNVRGGGGKKKKKENEEEAQKIQDLLGEQTMINKINTSNNHIKDLNDQMFQQTIAHQKQLQELKTTYEKEILQLKENQDEAHQKEINEMVSTLANVRNQLDEQMKILAKQIQINRSGYEVELLNRLGTIQELTNDLQHAKNSVIRLFRVNEALTQRHDQNNLDQKAWNRRKYEEYQDLCSSLVSTRSTVDLDLDDEKTNITDNDDDDDDDDDDSATNKNRSNSKYFTYNNNNDTHNSNYNHNSNKHRTSALPNDELTQTSSQPTLPRDVIIQAPIKHRSSSKKKDSTSASLLVTNIAFPNDLDSSTKGSAQSAVRTTTDISVSEYMPERGKNTINRPSFIRTDTTMGSSAFAGGSSKSRRRLDRLHLRDVNLVGQVESARTKSADPPVSTPKKTPSKEYDSGNDDFGQKKEKKASKQYAETRRHYDISSVEETELREEEEEEEEGGRNMNAYKSESSIKKSNYHTTTHSELQNHTSNRHNAQQHTRALPADDAIVNTGTENNSHAHSSTKNYGNTSSKSSALTKYHQLKQSNKIADGTEQDNPNNYYYNSNNPQHKTHQQYHLQDFSVDDRYTTPNSARIKDKFQRLFLGKNAVEGN